MTKRELIIELENLVISDDTEVVFIDIDSVEHHYTEIGLVEYSRENNKIELC